MISNFIEVQKITKVNTKFFPKVLLTLSTLLLIIGFSSRPIQAIESSILPFDLNTDMVITQPFSRIPHSYPWIYHCGDAKPPSGIICRTRDYTAIDYAPAYGQTVQARASLSGKAYTYRQSTGFGYHVKVNYNNGQAGVYAHCKPGSIAVSNGQNVRQGTPLCTIGTSGTSTGIHLHYERRPDQSSDKTIPVVFTNQVQGSRSGYIKAASLQPPTLESAIKGRVSVHRGGNSRLYVSWDNNQGQWQHPPAEIAGPYGPSQTGHSPVAVYDKYGKLNVFHVGMNGQVYQQILEGNEWRTINTGLVTGAQPEVVLHEGYLNIYARGGQSQLLHVSSGDNRTWGQVRTIPTNYPVYGKPSAAVRGREIMVAYPTSGNQIATHYSTTGQGYTNRLVPGLRTRREIGLVSYNGRFVMVHVGDNLKGYLNFTENAVGWSSARGRFRILLLRSGLI